MCHEHEIEVPLGEGVYTQFVRIRQDDPKAPTVANTLRHQLGDVLAAGPFRP
jgi:hypothetical protein